MSEKKEPKRVRIWVNKVDYDKINDYAKTTGKVAGSRIVDILMCAYIEKEDL